MKKCPTCSKEFPDSMRFCQSDGTPLLDIIETPPIEDPYKTTVGKSEDFSSLIPPEDPFKTVVGSAPKSDDSGDLLQLPEEHDPLKTSFIPEAQLRQELNLDEPVKESVETPSEFPPLPSPEDFVEPEASQTETPAPPVFNVPEPPKFNEPSVTPPPFDWSNSSSTEEKKETVAENVPTFDTSPPPIEPDYSEPPTLISEPFKFDPPAPPKEEPPKFEAPKFEPPPKVETSNDSPFNSPFNAPIPSPFDDAKPSKYEAPSTPLPSFKEPEPIVEEPVNNPFAPTPFGQANDPFNQPVKQNDWTPPPAPEANWQNQNIGQNTPFQPPVAGGSVNQTLPIISLVLGIVSLCCYVSPLTGLAAVITGYLGMKNANNDPQNYGGKGLAIAGMITGGIFLLIGIAYWLYIIFVIGFVGLSNLGR